MVILKSLKFQKLGTVFVPDHKYMCKCCYPFFKHGSHYVVLFESATVGVIVVAGKIACYIGTRTTVAGVVSMRSYLTIICQSSYLTIICQYIICMGQFGHIIVAHRKLQKFCVF